MNLFGIHSHDHFLIYLSRSLSLSHIHQIHTQANIHIDTQMNTHLSLTLSLSLTHTHQIHTQANIHIDTQMYTHLSLTLSLSHTHTHTRHTHRPTYT